jgi:hypothetical protein
MRYEVGLRLSGKLPRPRIIVLAVEAASGDSAARIARGCIHSAERIAVVSVAPATDIPENDADRAPPRRRRGSR